MVRLVKTFRGACEGLQEVLYFKKIQELINESDEYTYRVNFILYNSNGGAPKRVVLDALSNAGYVDKDKLVAIYDHDFKDESFKNSIKLADKYKIFPAYSNICFNLFLILHKKMYCKSCTLEDKYENDLKKIYQLSGKGSCKSAKNMEKILKQIDLKDVMKAIERSYKVNEKTKETEDVILKNVYKQPFLNIHLFLDKVFKEIK